MAEKNDRITERFRLRGRELGDLFGRIVTMQEGDSIGFNGLVYVKDDSERVSTYRGELSLRLNSCGAYRSYSLISGFFTVAIDGVGNWTMRDIVHPIRPGREHEGPYLFADRDRPKGAVVIESMLELPPASPPQ